MSFETEKLKFLNMSCEEKRVYYNNKTKKEAVTLDDIPTWFCYWKNNCGTKNSEEATKSEEGDEEKQDSIIAEKISLWSGDITALQVDVIVNAANRGLQGGGGVDGAIHKIAGPKLKQECATVAPCEVGGVRITGGYALPSKYVIHTVGPQGKQPDKLRECYERSLALAKENRLRSIAFPCISTGIYGYPQRDAAEVAIGTVKKFLEINADYIDRVVFCLFLQSDKKIYEELLKKFFAMD